jgi:hypothetical protein
VSGFAGTVGEDDIDNQLQKIPMYVAIKRVDPEAYRNISAALIDAHKLGRSTAELIASTFPYISKLSKKYLPVASDEAVITTAQLIVIETEAIGSKSANACYDFLNPHAGSQPVILTEYINQQTQELDLSTTAAVIETGATNPQRVPTEKEVSPLLKKVIGKLAKRYSATELGALTDPSSPGIEHEKVCRMASALYREVLILPARDAARLLRFLFATIMTRSDAETISNRVAYLHAQLRHVSSTGRIRRRGGGVRNM